MQQAPKEETQGVNKSEQPPIDPYEEEEDDPADRPIRKYLITFWVITGMFGVMILLVLGAGLYLWNELRPPGAGEAVTVEISRGTSPNKVVELLEEKGLIRNSFIFKYYLRYMNEGEKFQAGVYELNPSMDRNEIIAKLNAGDIIRPATVRFTIPEGFTVLQIADKLAAEKIVDKASFMEAVQSVKMKEHGEASSNIPESDKLHQRLEGYLFPETYEVVEGSTAETIIERMLHELDRKLKQLPANWDEELEARNLTFHQLMVIASLIEREVVVDSERPLVSSVIYNRLKAPQRLEIDATVQYALDKPKERLMNKDLEIESPYNTYRNDGLPPGPIASPSLASIEAALYPEDTDYKFYVTKKDGSNTHLFAKTYSEHLKNIEISNQTSTEGG
ncbi:endolytic transglycosylase MltG [Paenibacillaceae bacterium]|nr:endolytic transglycosylase MltG [Paenibacillaceae bacterium]